MITPILIQIIYWIGTFIGFAAGLYMFVAGEDTPQRILGFFLMFLGPLTIRIYAEILLLSFKIYETLTEIKKNTERNQSP